MMSEIKFSDGIEKIKEDYNKIIYPEELLDKKCAGCVRCEKRIVMVAKNMVITV